MLVSLVRFALAGGPAEGRSMTYAGVADNVPFPASHRFQIGVATKRFAHLAGRGAPRKNGLLAL
jgi:hypothetical protein